MREDCNGNILTGTNTITTNGETAFGILIAGSSWNTVSGTNTITTNGAGAHGIKLYNNSNSNIVSGANTITANGSGADGILVSDSSNNTFSGNTVTSKSSYGFYLATCPGAAITGNAATNSGQGGFYFAGDNPSGGYSLSQNSIYGNTAFGVMNAMTSGTVNAANNWWGSASGPGTVGLGSGDKVSANVTYDPWYLDAAMTTLSSAPRSVVYVDAISGNDSRDGSTPALAKKTLQAGIDIAAVGGTVNVAGGTYSEHITITKSLTLQGSSEPSPIIDGEGAGTAVTISASDVTVTGFTIQNAVTGIAATSGTGNVVHFCNIVGNSSFGVDASTLSGGTTIDATDNYWGGSGPSGGLTDPVTAKLANGTGSRVSANVLFDPWTGMSTECVVTAPGQVQGNTVTNPCADTSLNIVEAPGGGTTDVTIALYTSPPPDTPSFGAGATYVDIQLSNPAAVTQMIITFTDMSPGTVIYFYRPGTGWIACSNQTQVGTTITVTVTAATTPTLLELTGTIFAEGTAKGNVNGDSVIDVLDARLCLQIATGFLAGTPVQRAAADVDNDGDVDLADAEILAQYIIGIITELGPGAE